MGSGFHSPISSKTKPSEYISYADWYRRWGAIRFEGCWVLVHIESGWFLDHQDVKTSVYRIVQIINLLIDHGAEVGFADKLGRTPLHRSARLRYGAVTKLLVNRGSVVTTEDNNGHTARNLAKGSDRIIKALNGKEPGFYMYNDRIILL
jgi:hypothetical protein